MTPLLSGRSDRGSRRAAAAVVAACALILPALAGVSGLAAQERGAGPPQAGSVRERFHPLPEGTAAPEFVLPDMEGGRYSSAEEKGKRPLLIVFFSVFCEPCRETLAAMRQVHDRGAASSVEMVAISLDGKSLAEAIRGFARQEAYPFRILLDEAEGRDGFRAADLYGVADIPALFLVDRGGVVVWARVGRTGDEELSRALRARMKP